MCVFHTCLYEHIKAYNIFYQMSHSIYTEMFKMGCSFFFNQLNKKYLHILHIHVPWVGQKVSTNCVFK